MLSRAYQLSSEHDEANYTADPDNRLVWRASRRRLDAEAIRDAMLAASGELDLARPEGSAVMRLRQRRDRPRHPGRPALDELAATARSVYLPLVRGVVPEMLSVFDFADPSLVVGQREITTVATQALYLMNSPFVLEQSLTMAERLVKRLQRRRRARRPGLSAHAGPPGHRRASGSACWRSSRSIKMRWNRTARRPSRPAVAAWSSVCQALFASAEFRYVY